MATTTANGKATDVRQQAKQAFGFVPNLIDEMAAHNPAVAETYLASNGAIEAGGLLSPAEQQVVILAISGYNDCHYCTKAHAAAGKGAGLDEGTIRTLVEGGLPTDDRQRALVRATKRVLGKRGWLGDADLSELETKGVSRGELYEIITLIGIKTMSNYINHIAQTEVDPQFS
ncbi:MAG: carboxymuconolactone decarboxylase family protein [Bacteroidetes bacterium]|jgi:uncharacterized peroxidase-related enzyme|nr:carboxymuconolactone decarboxylase family protein [Bacteroidota bacterium]